MLLSPPGRALLLAGLLALTAAGCGRKGALEAPPDPSARPPGQSTPGRAGAARSSAVDGPATQGRAGVADVQASQASANRAQIGATSSEDDEDEEGSLLPGFLNQPAQTNSPLRRRPYKVPKEPFILDPLL